jgi:hypothetical protein
MTRYFDSVNRGRGTDPNKGKVVIDVDAYDEDLVREWVCPWCDHVLQARRSRKEIDCPNCTATLDLGGATQETKTIEDPNKSKAASTEVYAATLPGSEWVESQITRKPVEPKGSFAELQRRGLRITNYTETDGAGRPISWKRKEDEE